MATAQMPPPLRRPPATAAVQPPAAEGRSSNKPPREKGQAATPESPVPEVVPAPKGAEEAVCGVTLEQVEGIALANNPSLGRAAARVDVARGRWLQAGLYPNPEIGYVATEIGNEGSAGQHGGMVAQQIVTGNKLRLNREVAARDVAVAEQDFAAQRFRVLTDVRVAFYDVLVNQARVRTAGELVQISDRLRILADNRKKAGLEDDAALAALRAGIEASNAKLEHQKAEFARDASWRNLAALAGAPDMSCGCVTGALEVDWPQYDWCQTLDALLSQSPEMSAAVIRIERAQWALRRANVEPIPDVHLQGMVQKDDATQDTIFGAQGTIALPLFNRNQGNIAASRSELLAAQRDADRVAAALHQRLAPVFQAYQAARLEVESYRARSKQYEALLDQASKLYRAELVAYTEVLLAQNAHFQARLSYLEALRQLRAALARIDGLLLWDSLKD
jgi:cobalt-zinc-cadmium efflux system outer membrane protein